MKDRFAQLIVGLTVGGFLFLGSQFVTAFSEFAGRNRFEMVGATPRGIVVFDTQTGFTIVTRPIPFPTTTTQPGEEQ